MTQAQVLKPYYALAPVPPPPAVRPWRPPAQGLATARRWRRLVQCALPARQSQRYLKRQETSDIMHGCGDVEAQWMAATGGGRGPKPLYA